MDHLIINGKQTLRGEVAINGSKNAATAILPAAIMCSGICVIDNLPNVDDILSLVEAMRKIGCKCDFKDKHTLIIDPSGINTTCANHESVRKLRGSYYLVGALLGRFGKAEVTLPGGCNFGTRPIDQHEKGLEALGASVTTEHGMIKAFAEKLTGANIYLDVASVGATINIMLAASCADGLTTIENAAKEPHVVDCANFLNVMGAKIKGAGTDVIKITGVNSLHGGEYTIIPDQIECGTFMIAAAATAGEITVKNIIPKHMDSVSAKLAEMGCKVEERSDSITVTGYPNLKHVNVKTMAYPGFPTDLQPQMTALLCNVSGTSIITETVFDNRYQYITELRRLGCNVTVDGRVAIINQLEKLTGADVNATDLRAGAALIIGALCAEGTTDIGNIKYVDRGYEAIEEKLANLGADIKRVSKEE
ncbi:MAG: UDP-N-acetylglucosamine 1-carboxyvinyltransferase [Clostridiales bacterium]|jgi:UDP-N-acetylglucosamine 1-carboxyvinyltransferase|nr:UDP-N-acetylglucosamine 1-carboxyvinyltransferase [Clostridiales bacterium]